MGRLAFASFAPDIGDALITTAANAVKLIARWVLLIIILVIALGFIEGCFIENARHNRCWKRATLSDLRELCLDFSSFILVADKNGCAI